MPVVPSNAVRVFFYGSFINSRVLENAGVEPRQLEVARLPGFDLRIEPLANLVRSERHAVYGVLCQVTHGELDALYHQDWVGTYLPEAVLVETLDGKKAPALCYFAPSPKVAPASDEYVDRIADAARDYGFPDWYLQRVDGFRSRVRQRADGET